MRIVKSEDDIPKQDEDINEVIDVMENAEVDEGEDAINLDDDDLIVMDADEFLERAEEQFEIEGKNMEEEEKDDDEDASLQESSSDIKRDSIYSFEEHTDSVLCVAFNPYRPLQLVTGGQDDKAFLIQLSDDPIPTVTSISLTGHQDSVCGVAFSFTGEYVATVDMNGMIKVWLSATGALVKTLEGPEEPEWIRWHGKANVLMASGNDFCIWSWNLPSGMALPMLCGHTDVVTCSTTNPSGQLLITGSLDNTLKLWKLKTHEMVYSFRSDEHNWHKDGVVCVDVHPQTALCVSGARDGTVILSNAKTHRVLNSYEHKSTSEDVNCSVEIVRFNDQFNWVASASMNSSVIVYDYDSNRIRQELKHNGGVVKMAWHPNGFVLITGCLDGCIYAWDARSGRNLYTLSGHTDLLLDMDIYVLDKMLYIASVSDDKTCQIYRVRI